eukprot:TRINITY_DN58761_c0_g1_i1.p1 TRINITY_DN58761_c0_g1~~TRINITY_DN58761_c0_g1_i1.p1  ORF type:complete len:1236 (-),score=362.70 TRINITY_DN58761_c0_g1_i1:102-3809(-)
MQESIHAKVLQLLQKATVERDIGDRIRVLRQAEDVLLHPETPQETVAACLEYFINLQADPTAALRRFAAHFLERTLLLKPALALRFVPTVASMLKDVDGVVQELAARCACALWGRALYWLSLEGDKVAFQVSWEALQQVRTALIELLADGCPGRPALFRQVVRWVRVCVLTQTPSTLLVRIRIPTELRGASCLQDFPSRAGLLLNLDGLRRHGEELFDWLCKLILEPAKGLWSRLHIAALIRCAASIGRQRPSLLRRFVEVLRPLLKNTAAEDADGVLPVAQADAPFLGQLLWEEVQRLLASSVALEWHSELLELLGASGDVCGLLEEVSTQAKYQQIRTAAEKRPLTDAKDSLAKRACLQSTRRAWADTDGAFVRVGDSAFGLGALASEDAFDGDAVLSGEAEVACRRFEDYFGLPSQREPAGHIPGAALLSSRISNNSELARLALTSLNNLAEKRFLLRDKAHERAVLFDEQLLRKAAADAMGGDKKKKASGLPEIAFFLSAKAEIEEEPATRDPRAGPLGRKAEAASQGSAPNGAGHGAAAPAVAAAGKLPEAAARDKLQLQLFEEVLQAQRRMAAAPLGASMSGAQSQAFGRLSRQVALHVAAGFRLAVPASLQRSMCRAYMARALDGLKLAIENKVAADGASAIGQLAELFYAKYSVDLAKNHDSTGLVAKPASTAATKTAFNDILEGGRSGLGVARPGTFTYAELFDILIAEFERRELPRRELRSLLAEIPVVPVSAFRMLEAQCRAVDEKPRKVALMTLLALLEGRPSCRWQGIFLLFRLAYGAADDDGVRFDTIRLIINKIYNPGGQPPMRWQLPHLDDAEAGPRLPGGSIEKAAAAAKAAAQATDHNISLQKLRGRCVEDVATLMLRSMASTSARYRFPIQVSKRVEQLRAALFEGQVPFGATAAGMRVCIPKDRIWLYMALCIKRPMLLHGLVETFTQCDEAMKDHLVSSVEEAIKHIPASEPELLMLVQKATPETERLVLKVLHILMQASQGKEGLTPAYGEAVTRLYGLTKNPRLLVPVFDLLERRNLLDFLPAVMQLDQQSVTDAFGLLVRSKSPPLSITELLTELHHMNKPGENIVPVKFSMQALNIIFGMRDKFDSKVYGIVIQSLVEDTGKLPTLFMRTVIQVVKELPKLSDFIVKEILPRLVRQEVWSDDSMWRGFMLVLQHTFASQPGPAARVLTMLPASHLEDVLVQHPDWKAQLVEFVMRQPTGSVPPHVRQLLQ